MPAQKSKEETIRHQVLDAKCLEILSGAKVFCSVCNKSFTCNKTNHVPDHLKGKNHSEALLLKKPRQSILVPKDISGNGAHYLLLTYARSSSMCRKRFFSFRYKNGKHFRKLGAISKFFDFQECSRR